MTMRIELRVCLSEEQRGGKWVEWTLYEDEEIQDQGVVVNQRYTVEDMVLTAIGDIFHTTTRRI